MNKGKKFIALTKTCISNPRIIKKGMKYISQNGIHGFMEHMKARANYEYLAEQQQAGVIVQSNDLFNSNIKFSVLMPTYNVDKKWVEKAIHSVKCQNYINWELCIVDDASTKKETISYLKSIDDNRIKIKLNEQNKGISSATNDAAAMATGDYIVLIDNDDQLFADALHEFAKEIQKNHPDIIYSDHDIIDQADNHSNPFLKPSWSPELMTCQMYVGHLLGFKRELFEKVGGFRTEYNGSQDYDLFLRMCLHTDKIAHVEKVLYSWRALPSSTATNPDSKPYAQTAGLKAIQNYLDTKYGKGYGFVEETDNLFVYDVRYPIVEPPKVSVIIPTKDHVDLLKQLIDSIFEKTDYPDYELIIINNNSEQEDTIRFFEKIESEYDNVHIHNVFREFNWSYLNNYGMSVATGDVYIFLNNDTKIIQNNWMTRLAELAVRDEIGVVGPMLLYEDDTIQHAGVVVGMNGWADHVFKGMQPKHEGTPYVSPMVTRNVLAVTGACMTISKKTIEKIGAFNDDFIICGSDVEICLRAYQYGLRNVYTPFVKLYHYESKSRDSFVPECDFIMSEKTYAPYRGKDPYYNSQLDYYDCKPSVNYEKLPFYLQVDNKNKGNTSTPANIYFAPEVMPYTFRVIDYPRKRINLLLPSINPEHVFGGISTALKFYNELCETSGYDRRIILVDANPNDEAKEKYSSDYDFVRCDEDSISKNQIVGYADRYEVSIPVSENDYFIQTGWWTAECLQEALKEQEKTGFKVNPMIYFIQDYEPGFYPWSTQYMLAMSTYKCKYKQIALFNSQELYDYMKNLGYKFYKEYVFSPVFNESLKKYFFEKCSKCVSKKKRLLIYGRPGTVRNAFELIVMSLSKWVWMQPDIEEWEILSAGEQFNNIVLGNGKIIKSVGKLSLKEYAHILETTSVGLSLMVSPHPSYPPLEMATFGATVITNSYANKNLSIFSSNIVSLDEVSPSIIAEKLMEVCNNYQEEVDTSKYNLEYVNNDIAFPFIENIVQNDLM